MDVLEANGVEVAVFDQIGWQGGSFCMVGMQETVQRMLAGGVDVVFNMLNAVSLPGFVTEMVNQGYQPGDVHYYGSEFNSAGVEIVASKVVAFGGEASGRLYNGAVTLQRTALRTMDASLASVASSSEVRNHAHSMSWSGAPSSISKPAFSVRPKVM